MKLETLRFRSFCNGEDYASQKLFIIDAILINAAYVITTGVVLSGYVLYLGGSDFLTALINNSASFSAIICIFSYIIFEKRARRKNLLIGMNLVSRTLLTTILILPFIFKDDKTMFIFLAMVIIASDVIFSIFRVGWLVWIMEIAPARNRINYVYMRMFYLRCAFSVVTLASGFVLDLFDKGYTGFLILFCFSYLLSLADVLVLRKIREKTHETDTAGGRRGMFMLPVKSVRYREFLIFIFLFYFSYAVSASYMPVYTIKYLNFDYRLILSLNVLSIIAMLVSNLAWMRIENKKGGRFVLSLSTLIQALGLLLMGFLTANTQFLYYISSILLGIGSGGFNTTSFSYRYEIMPEDGKTVFEGWYFLVFGLSSLIAPFAGKFFISALPEISNNIFPFARLQFLFLASFMLLCLTVIYLGTRKKENTETVIG